MQKKEFKKNEEKKRKENDVKKKREEKIVRNNVTCYAHGLVLTNLDLT